MADGLYVAMTGAAARAEQLESIADNLANAETPGFKASRPVFQSFLASAGQTDKVFTAAVATGVDMSAGQTVVTDNPLDVLPDGPGFLAVRTGLGQVAYTRNGELKIGPGNVLVSDGHPVLGVDGQPITLPLMTTATIANDGRVMADGQPIGQLAQFALQGRVKRIGGAIYAPEAGGSATMLTGATLKVGEIETGNSSPLQATVAMISAQRVFEAAMQAMTTCRRLDDKAIEMGKVR